MLPAWAVHYGIRPWEIDLMTLAEISEFIVDWQRKASADGR